MKKLDKSQAYGQVCGAGRAKFEQNGLLFDVHGDEILAEGRAASRPAIKKKTKATPKPDDSFELQVEVDDQISAQTTL